MKKVLAFGTFDLIHPGHLFFLKEAKKYGDHLTVLISRDATVKFVKGRPPHFDENVRRQNVIALGIADDVILGSDTPDKYSLIEAVRPDVICLGYDQKAFTESLGAVLAQRGLHPEIIRIGAYSPHIYKSSKLREQLGKDKK